MQAPEPSSGQRKQDILRQALKRETRLEQAAFLEGACGDDTALRAELEALLVAHAANQGTAALQADAVGVRVEESASELIPTLLDQTPVTEGPGTVIGRYKLLEQIGEGGFGVVYVAEQQQPVRRQVALKIIKLGMDTRQVVARFEAERQALALMDHPNIAKVFDAGATDTGRPFFVMELVKGVPITQYCDQQKLSTSPRLGLFIKVCQAVQHAHQKGIIHRDIKPSNILVTLQEGTPVPKVIDFGIAKATQQKLTEMTLHTQIQQFIGTPAYMSPEQAEMSGLDIDTRSDIYSLGVLLYELLVGKTPFDSQELMAAGLDEMRRTIREKEPPRPSTRLSTMAKEELTTATQRRGVEAPKLISLLRGDLDWIVMKCLEKDRTRRYETANGLAMDLTRHLNNEPVVARPPSAAYRFQKALRRNRLAVGASGAVVLALLIGLATTFWQWGRAEHQRAASEHLLYVTKMNLAQAAWEQNNITRVRELLAETATAPQRGFEWFYWQRQTHLELKTLRGHTKPILAVAYSPDGQRIVTGSADGTAREWDAASGKSLLTLRGHGGPIRSAAFSSDGQRIVTGSWDKTAIIWNATNGARTVTLGGHDAEVLSAAFSADGRRIVTGSFDQTARIWDAATGNELLRFKGHTNGVWAVAFSPDGRRIVTGSWDQTAKVWDAANGNELGTLVGHRGGVMSVAFSPDGQRIVTGSYDHEARVWETATGKELGILKGHGAPVASVTFSPDGRRIATAGDDQTARVWDAGRVNELLAVKMHGSRISSVAFSPDSQRIVTGGGSMNSGVRGELPNIGSGDQTTKIWEASNDREFFTLKGHTDGVGSVAFSQDGQWIVTGSFDNTAKVWEASSGQELFSLVGHTNYVRSVAISPDGRRIVTGSWDWTAKVWDTATRKEMFSLIGHSNAIMSVTFSPDGRRIATGGQDQMAKVWDASDGKELLTLKGHSGWKGDDGWIWSVAFSPDGRRIVTSNEGEDHTVVTVWDAASGKEVFTIRGHSSWVASAVFSPDGRRIVTGSYDKTAKVWDAATGNELLTLTGHSDQLLSVSFSPDGKRIVTGSRDQTAKLWDATTGKELLTFKGHGDWILSVAFSQDGRRIATASRDHTVRVWEAASTEQVARWQTEEREQRAMEK